MIRVRLQRRSAVDARHRVCSQRPPTSEVVAIIKSGVNIVVDGIDQFGSIDVDTDNLVIWTEGTLDPRRRGHGRVVPVARTGRWKSTWKATSSFARAIARSYAQRMYYDVRRADRHRADGRNAHAGPKLRRACSSCGPTWCSSIGRDHFIAQNASLTSSRFGVPGYELRSGLMTLRRRAATAHQPLHRRARGGRRTGAPIIDHQKLATSRNNFIYVEQVPVFYWPFMATDLDKPNYYIDAHPGQERPDLRHAGLHRLRRLSALRHPQSAAGHQVDPERRLPEHARTGRRHHVQLRTPDILRHARKHQRLRRRLGDRRSRARQPGFGPPRSDSAATISAAACWPQHRQLLPNNFQLTGEVGLISDFNFLEQYFEREWDQLKDQSTDLELKQYRGQQLVERVRRGAAQSISSPRRSGCRGSTTSGSASRCWATA